MIEKNRTVEIMSGTPGTAGRYLRNVFDPKSKTFFAPDYRSIPPDMKNLHERGFKGQGFRIAILDSGMMLEHPLIKRNLVDSVDFTGEGPEDRNGHGTIVALIAILMSPESDFINVKVMDAEGQGEEEDLVKGIQWCIENDIFSINLSAGQYRKKWGLFPKDCDGTCDLCRIAQEATYAGIIITAAAGNGGPKNIPCPQIIGLKKRLFWVCQVLDLKKEQIASFSGKGNVTGPPFDWPMRPLRTNFPDVNKIGLTLGEYVSSLECREQEIRKELTAGGKKDLANVQVLTKTLEAIFDDRANLEASYEELKRRLANAINALLAITQRLRHDQVDQACKALTCGDTKGAEKLIRKILGDGKEEAAEAAYQLGVLTRSRFEYFQAYCYFNRAAELQGENPFFLCEAGTMAHTLEHYAVAQHSFRRAVDIFEAKFGRYHRHTAMGLNNLSMTLNALGRFTEAEPLIRLALEIREAKLNQNHPDVLSSLDNLAVILQNLDNFDEAETVLRKVLRIREAQIGENEPIVADKLNNLANTLRARGQLQEAETLHRRVICIYEARLGKDDPRVAWGLNNLALLLQQQGNMTEAETLYRRAIIILNDQFGKIHPNLAMVLNGLGVSLHEQGKYTESAQLYSHALKICERWLGNDHPNTKMVRNNLHMIRGQES